MKKLLRDIALVIIVFGVILAAPFFIRGFKEETPFDPQPVSSREIPQTPERMDTGSNETALRPETAEIIAKRMIQPAPGGNACVGLSPARRQILDVESILQGHGDSIVTGGKEVTDNMMEGRISAGGGTDRLRADGAGYADMSVDHLDSVEVYELKNDQPNVINVFASGLETVGGAHAVIIGDDGIDSVTLDPCLLWSEPVVSGGFVRYDAHDNDGNAASISVSEGIIVTKRPD